MPRLSILLGLTAIFLTALTASAADDLYKEFQPSETSRVREATEWSIFNSFDTLDTSSKRLLLIGDSICNGYYGLVRQELGERMRLSLWVSSKCVTDRDYFRELDLILSANRYDVISFNNGLHSLTTDRAEWEKAYRGAVRFIRAKCPDAKLYLCLSTPLKEADKTAVSKALNDIALRVADEEKLPVIDLFGLMDPLDRDTYWSDVFHFKGEAIQMQAKKIVETIVEPAE